MKTNFGMWLFLASELMIFGVLIMLFEINFGRYEIAFMEASGDIHFLRGTINTIVLLTSSYFVALSLEKKQRHWLVLAILLGLIFLMIKGSEYYALTEEGKFILNFSPNVRPEEKLFFTFYAFLTFLHSLHVLVGVGLLAAVWKMMRNKDPHEFHENVGLYWHFVDLVWVYLYPMFYLLGH